MIRWAKKQWQAIAENWNYFWFDSRSDEQLSALGLMRISFCFVMLFFYFTRSFDIAYFYSGDGILPAWYAKNVDIFRYHPTIFGDATPLWLLHSLHSLLLACLFCQMIGFLTRPAAILGYFLHLMFLNRNLSVIFGVDMIGSFFLLYLCFADAGARYSVDAKLGWGPKRQSVRGHIAWRLMQVQLCVVYAFSGLEKCKGVRWWNGSALWDVLTMGNMQRWDLSFVAHAPILLAAAVYIVLFWEIYFPVLVWVPKLRRPMLLFGLLMHLGIYVFLNLPTFGFMMISLYVLFLTRAEVEQIVALVRAGWRKPRAIPTRS